MSRPRGTPKTGGRKAGSVNKNPRPLKELAQQHTESAVACLVEIYQDKSAPHAARVSAAKELLDRGNGKSVAHQVIQAEVTTPKTLDAFYGSPDK